MCCLRARTTPSPVLNFGWRSGWQIGVRLHLPHGRHKFDDGTEAQLREIVTRGISSFKIFLAYKGAFGIDDTELYRTLKLARELGVIVTAHCENETLIAERQRSFSPLDGRIPASITKADRHC